MCAHLCGMPELVQQAVRIADWGLVSFEVMKNFWLFRITCLSHPEFLRLHICKSPHMLQSSISLYPSPNSLLCIIQSSVLVIYLPDPVVYVLPSVIKITQSFCPFSLAISLVLYHIQPFSFSLSKLLENVLMIFTLKIRLALSQSTG